MGLFVLSTAKIDIANWAISVMSIPFYSQCANVLIENSDLMIRLDCLWKCLSIDQLFTLAAHVHRYTPFTCWAKRVKILYINIIEYRMVSLSWQIFNICQSFLSKRWWNVAKMGTTSGQRYRIYWNSIGMRHWFLNCMAASTSNMLLPIYFSVLIWPRSSEILTATDERPWDISPRKISKRNLFD